MKKGCKYLETEQTLLIMKPKKNLSWWERIRSLGQPKINEMVVPTCVSFFCSCEDIINKFQEKRVTLKDIEEGRGVPIPFKWDDWEICCDSCPHFVNIRE